MKNFFVVFGAILATVVASACHAIEVTSPNGRIVATFEVKDTESTKQCAVYRVSYDGKPLITDSRLRFQIKTDDSSSKIEFGDNLVVLSEEKSEQDATWRPVYGERSTIRDQYRQVIVICQDSTDPELSLRVTLRVYDSGVAFLMSVVGNDTQEYVTIVQELTEFTFLDDHTAWCTTNAQGIYEPRPLSKLGEQVERPLTIRTTDDQPVYVAVGEAELFDFSRMKLRRSKKNPLCIVSQLHSPAKHILQADTPWRVIMIADSPGELLENNDIFLNLNRPCKIEDTSWIRPGKVIREITLTDEGAEACIDFAVKYNLQFVEFDAGWYGHEYDDASDATTITVDPKRSAGPLDLRRHIKVANEKGLGVILYVNRRALEKQLDEILPLYKSWGVAGVKYGFVNVGSQKWTRWLHEAIRKAAEHELMVDVHDEYRPTGFSRTYPNLMTVEGIGGDETAPTNKQTLMQLFTRCLAGASDNKICYFDARVEEKQNHAAQLAKAVMMYDPWQFLFWYDSPAESLKKKRGEQGYNVIVETPELEFWKHMPTVWDDSRVLHGEIGEYATIARRSGLDWYVVSLNSDDPQDLKADLDFLEPNQKYIAHVYSHDPSLQTRTHVRIERLEVDQESTLPIKLIANSGQAVRIVPAK
ncbi:MAG: glycoside hydrolase family 97 N-terminal domain-containing protein [Lacipirellulaceae bacterium]